MKPLRVKHPTAIGASRRQATSNASAVVASASAPGHPTSDDPQHVRVRVGEQRLEPRPPIRVWRSHRSYLPQGRRSVSTRS